MRILITTLVICMASSALAQDKPHIMDKKFWLAQAALAVAKSADAVTTSQAQGRGCIETNPLFGQHPSNARLAGVNVAYFAGEVGLAYVLKKFGQRHRWARHLWLIEPSIQTAQHVRLAAHNAGLQCR